MAEIDADGVEVPTLQQWLAALSEEDRTALEMHDVQDEFVRWSGSFAWLSSRLADAEADLAYAELETKRAIAKAAKTLAAPSGQRKPSDKLIAHLVALDATVQAAEGREVEAKRAYTKMRGIVEAARGKKDMAVQAGARERVELEREPVLREQATRKLRKHNDDE